MAAARVDASRRPETFQTRSFKLAPFVLSTPLPPDTHPFERNKTENPSLSCTQSLLNIAVWCCTLFLLGCVVDQSRLPVPSKPCYVAEGFKIVPCGCCLSAYLQPPDRLMPLCVMSTPRVEPPVRLLYIFGLDILSDFQVFDEDTGRWRLVKGTGEIIERIVSRQEQQEIQQHASRWGWDHKVLSQASSSSAAAAAAKLPFGK